MGTGMVPGTYGHWKGAWAHKYTLQMPGYIRAPEGFPGTFGHQNGARINIGTGRMLGDLWKPEWSRGTYGHWKGAWAHKYILQMPGYIRAP